MSEEKKRNIPRIKKINIHQPADFQYDVLVGSGAFGKVRICQHQPGDNKSQGSTNSSDGNSTAPGVKMGKQLDKRSIMVAEGVQTLQDRRAI